MSEPSPEAKQAANWAGWHETTHPEHHRAYTEGYDAATAKLELELQRANAKCAEQSAATAKLREAFEQYVSNEGGMNFEKFAAIMRGQQLAHQQPSAKVEDWQDDPAKVAANKAFSAKVNAIKSGEPSATTPDVEKIAQHWQIVDYGDSVGMVLQEGDDELAVLDTKLGYAKAARLRDRHNEALTQARAPLVEALEAWGDFPHPIKPHCDDCARAAIRAMELSFAALTGTEVK